MTHDRGSEERVTVDDAGSRSANPPTIQLIVKEQGDEAALTNLLNESYEVITSPDLESADCYVLDVKELPRACEALVERKRQAKPVFLPVLLIQRDDFPLDLDEFERRAEDVILLDEFIHAPVRKSVLDRRIGNLLARRRQSQSLQSDYQRMRRAVFSAGVAIYITDTEGAIEYVNPAFEEITGYSRDAAIGRNPRILNSGEMPAAYFEDLWDTVTAGEVWDEEVVNRRKSGEEYVAEQTIAPVTDPNGDIEGYVAIQQDITERKRRERHLKTLISNLPGIVYRCENTRGWPMEMVRGRSEALTGYSSHRIEAGEVSWGEDIIHPEDRERVWETVQEKIEADEPFELTYRIRTADGETRWVWERGRMVSPVGEPASKVEGFVTDISEQKELERDLRDSKERYESLFKSIQDAIVVADTDRNIVNCNPGFTEQFGYELDEIAGEPTSVLYESKAEFEQMGEEIRRHIGDPSFTYTIEYRKKSGQVFPGETSAYYLRDSEGEITGFIGVIRDVSDRQQRLTQLKIIDRVLQHKFHNDMNVIEGHLDLAADTAGPEVTSHLNTVRETATDLRRTVDKEREITKFLTDRPPKGTFDLRSTVEAARDRILSVHPQGEITVEGPQSVAARANVRISRALEELLENGIIHSESRSPTVAVRLQSTDDVVSIEIADEGPPIPEDERKILTGETELSPLNHHSGMGLWLVQLIINRSDGSLGFAVTEAGGNIVTVRLQRPPGG
jgi:PAS domain S-box-containing protein